jgi:transcription antitermination factor NusB
LNILNNIFANNEIIAEIADKLNSEESIWGEYHEIIKNIINTAESQTEIHKNPETQIKYLFEQIDNSETINTIFEEIDILWDYDKTIWKNMILEHDPRKFISQIDHSTWFDSYALFFDNIIDFTINNSNKLKTEVNEFIINWDIDKIMTLDQAIMIVAVAEHKCFTDTPIQIIINEYVEISKKISTKTSVGFVNGVLDKMFHNS